VPNDNARHVPDIAFAASWDHDGYLTFTDGEIASEGGTSAAAPLFAGVLALLNQHIVKSGFQVQPGLGNINPRLYELARTAPDVFHDVVSGDTLVPCRPGSPDCGPSGSYGFMAGPGYDHATGLGSIDIDKLFRNWADGPSSPGQNTASIKLSTPTPVVMPVSPDDTRCTAAGAFFQRLYLQEWNGVGVRLNKFIADSQDASARIAELFGSDRLPALGMLHADLCWNLNSVPETVSYEVAGVDDGGHELSATLQVQFDGPAANAAAANNTAGSSERNGTPCAYLRSGSDVFSFEASTGYEMHSRFLLHARLRAGSGDLGQRGRPPHGATGRR
jgi:hypothetical protein